MGNASTITIRPPAPRLLTGQGFPLRAGSATVLGNRDRRMDGEVGAKDVVGMRRLVVPIDPERCAGIGAVVGGGVGCFVGGAIGAAVAAGRACGMDVFYYAAAGLPVGLVVGALLGRLAANCKRSRQEPRDIIGPDEDASLPR